MALYVIGDPHLSFSVDKPMDIFGGRWADHPEKLKKAWLEKISSEDTVVLAGDLSWGISLKEAEADFAFLHSLPGKKILLKGNHDYWWETASKLRRFFAERGWEDFELLYNNSITAEGFALCGTRGWEAAPETEQDRKMLERELGRLERSLQAAEPGLQRIVFLHYPPMAGQAKPFLPLLKQYNVHLCYYGHLHGYPAIKAAPLEEDGVLFRLISADALSFCPRSVTADWVEFKQKEAASHQIGQKIRRFWAKLLSQISKKC